MRVVLEPLPKVPIGDIIKYVKKRSKTPKKIKKMVRSWMCVQHRLLGVPAVCQLFVLLHCTKVGLGSRGYENRSTFFFLVQRRGKEKKIYSEMLIFDYGNRLVKIVYIYGS